MGTWSGAANPKWQVQFADNTVWDTATLDSRIVVSPSTDNGESVFGTDRDDVVYGLGGDDVIYGFNGADTLNGDMGNDVIYGGRGSDILYGGAGDDQLFGAIGSPPTYGAPYVYEGDILSGGAGNDYLKGGSGVDTYLINRGDGFDYIDDDPLIDFGRILTTAMGDRNAVVFGDDITAETINVSVFTQLWIDEVVLAMLRIDAGL